MQQWLGKGACMLSYTHIVYLVNNNYYYYFLLQLGFHPVAAVLHQYRHHNTIHK
jgi:hypothetical protein